MAAQVVSTADAVAAWLAGQPHVAASARRAAGGKGDLDHFLALGFLQGLLTAPESLEAMLVSTKVDARHTFAHLRAVVVDEVHAFAGDDRGWHLLCVLERLSRVAGRPPQRVGLSATAGNPGELLSWLHKGLGVSGPGQVITPAPPAAGTVESRKSRSIMRVRSRTWITASASQTEPSECSAAATPARSPTPYAPLIPPT